jgi:hypothetical protein
MLMDADIRDYHIITPAIYRSSRLKAAFDLEISTQLDPLLSLSMQ